MIIAALGSLQSDAIQEVLAADLEPSEVAVLAPDGHSHLRLLRWNLSGLRAHRASGLLID
jgi:hypothetical protein